MKSNTKYNLISTIDEADEKFLTKKLGEWLINLVRLSVTTVIITSALPVNAATHVPIQYEPQEPVMITATYQPRLLYHVDPYGVMRDLKTRQIVNPYVIATSTIPQAEIGVGGGIMVGIVLGAGAGAGAAAAYVQGPQATQILLAGFFGGVAGYYGALAPLGGPITVIIYGTASIAAGTVGAIQARYAAGTNCGGNDTAGSTKCVIQIK